MDLDTIRKLDALNARFYKKIATDFNESRSYYWHGWREFLPYIELILAEREKLRILDIGCGNGRFGKFLYDYLPAVPMIYDGLDNNEQLLKLAAVKLATTHLDVTLQEMNVVKGLMNNSFLSDISGEYDVIALFGVIHHIPSLKLRKKIMSALAKRLAKHGVAIVTLWRFLDSQQLKRKIEPFDRLQIDLTQLEKNDYLLNWKRGSTAYRYCHYADQAEEKELIQASKLQLIDSFESDGKEGRGNKYLVLKQNKTN